MSVETAGRSVNDIWCALVRRAEAAGDLAAQQRVGAAMRHALGLGPTTSWNTVGMAISLDPRTADELAGAYLKAHRALEWH